MKQKTIIFNGYYTTSMVHNIPPVSGIYCVYACTSSINSNTVNIHKLLYVGESVNIRDRIRNHERLHDWTRQLLQGEELCFSYAHVASTDRNHIEAAIVNYYKPPCNFEYKYSFPYESIHISLLGRAALLIPNSITVYTH